ncbi:hypothetical protein [Flavobacterium psychrotolerans]|uniref:Lipoprotein n=1 Tax=Flavobacterium psychrotolerans TaxID=2169410 RepID=A0A2U1JMW7_9FLAO|nr:hypothetical protein [Flavobacterium psychrotolerans]PWA06511.1 hypothetical protein DB895_03590 [Flavobacterium psychrotolerans]
MKTKILMLGMILSVLSISCTKDDNSQVDTPISATDITANAKIDDVSDDVLQVVESQSNEVASAGRMSSPSENALGSGTIEITTDKTGNTWTRTINFGTSYTLYNGNIVSGKIIVSFTYDGLNSNTRTINYKFENFYHNNRHIEGNRTVVKTTLSNGHPQATIDLNMTVTTPEGGVFTRIGTRVREFTSGYGDTILLNNEFSITGNWTTTLPSGIIHTTTITSAVIVKMNCPHIVSGIVKFVRTKSTAVLDYGNGDCDEKATMTIDGVARNITLGK